MARALILALLLAGCADRAADAFDRALAALRAGDLRAAERWAARAAEAGGEEYAALHDFLKGNVAFARCRTAERQAATAAAEPFALDVALLYAEKAASFWQQAAMSRPDWPRARRNVERALRKAQELARRKEESRPRSEPQARPRPRPAPEPGRTLDEDAPTDTSRTGTLSREELLRRLAEKEREKRALREAQRAKRSAEVARDW